MSGNDKTPMTLIETLLLVIFRYRILVADAGIGIETLAEIGHRNATPIEWRDAIAEAVRAGYIHDPVRLPAGALQCHWHLELTPKGVAAVRRLRATTGEC